MNNPPYIIVDEMRKVVAAVAAKLGININYQHGYVEELNETLIQYSKTQTFEAIKFPCFWLAEPFTVEEGLGLGWYGKVDGLRGFIIEQTNRNRKAHDRMENIYKKTIDPIYYEWIKQMKKSPAFNVPDEAIFKRFETNRYYWGEKQQNVLKDLVDCKQIGFNLLVNNNKNCVPDGLQPS